MFAICTYLYYNNAMKTVFVTGGSRGIGSAVVEKFATSGYTVIFTYNNSKALAENLTSKLVALGCDVHPVQCNVANAVQVQSVFNYVKKWFKHVDVLVNNAGIALQKTVAETTEQDFDNVMNVNAKGAFFVGKYALELGTNSIVNVSSVWGRKGASCESVYSMSKHAVVGLTLSLASEYPDVCCNCVCPPIVLTDMCKHLSQQDIDDFCREHNTKAYTSSEVAEVIFSLALSQKTAQIVDM